LGAEEKVEKFINKQKESDPFVDHDDFLADTKDFACYPPPKKGKKYPKPKGK